MPPVYTPLLYPMQATHRLSWKRQPPANPRTLGSVACTSVSLSCRSGESAREEHDRAGMGLCAYQNISQGRQVIQRCYMCVRPEGFSCGGAIFLSRAVRAYFSFDSI
jgi:hypothetical protein